MAEERPAWQREIRALRRSLEALRARVHALEAAARAPSGAPTADDAPEGATDPTSEVVLQGLRKAPAHTGRLLLVLGGAYLLRALTEVGQVAPAIGAASGLVYGLFWLGLAERAGRGRDVDGATWHGVAAAAIVFPLLWETSSTFQSIPLSVAAALIAVCTLAAFTIAARHTVPALAAIFSGGASLCGLALMLPHPAAAQPVMIALLATSFTAMVLGRRHGLRAAMWISAGGADAAAALLLEGALRGAGAAPGTAILLLVMLSIGCVALITWDVLQDRRALDGFDATQTALALLVGFGAALLLADREGAHEALLGGGAIVVAMALYVLGFTVLRRDRRHAFLYLTSIALVLVLTASATLLAHPVVPWALLAVAAALTARQVQRLTLGLHACLYALAATFASGLVVHAADAWTTLTGPLPTEPAPWLALAALLVVGLVRVGPANDGGGSEGGVAARMRTAALVVFLIMASGVAMRGAGLLLPIEDLTGASAAWLAAARTVVLALITMACARAGRAAGYAALRRLVPVLLGAGAVKILFEDLVQGRPLSLALSFAAFGTALLLAPRLARAGAHPA